MPNDYTQPTENPYLTTLQNQETENQARFRATTGLALDMNPDEMARQRRVADLLGTPVAAVQALPKEADRAARLKELEANAATSPVLQRKYSDADFAKLAHDDSGALSAVAAAAKWFVNGNKPEPIRNLGEPGVLTNAMYRDRMDKLRAQNPALDIDASRVLARQGVTLDNVSQGLSESQSPQANALKLLAGLGTGAKESFYKADQGFTRLSADLLGLDGVATNAKRLADQSDARVFLNVPRPGGLGGMVYGGVQSTVQQLPGIAASVATGNPVPTLASIFATATGGSYGKYRDRGGSVGQAALGSGLEGVLEVATEYLPMKTITDKIGKMGAGAFAKEFFGKELVGEEVNTILSNAVDTAIANPGKTWGQYFAELPAEMVETAVQTFVQTGLLSGASRGLEKTVMQAQASAYRAQQAERHAQALQEIQTTMQSSKLLERSPGHLQSYAQDLADQGVPVVFVDSAKLVEAGVDLQALAQTVPSVAAQLEQARSGGDFAIPTGELLTNTIGTEFAQPLIDHARTDVNGMSREEAKAYMDQKGDQINAEIERVMAEKANDAEFKAGRDQVQTQILAQLNDIKRFTSNVNEKYAMLAASFYAVKAAQVGMTVQQFADTYKLGFSGQGAVGAGMYDQSNNGPVSLDALPLKGNDQAVVAKSLIDRTGLSSEQLGNIFEGATLGAQPDGLGGIPPLQSMLSHMRAAVLDDPKILDAVVGSVPVDMVNNLFGSQDAAKVALHDEAMLQDSTAFNADLLVSSGLGDTANSVGLLVREAASRAAEVARVSLGSGLEAGESAATVGAGQRNSFGQGNSSRAQISFGEDITLTRSIISLFSGADLSSFVHESGHFFLEVQTDLANRIAARAAQGEQISDGERSILDDMNRTLDWFGIKGDAVPVALSAEDVKLGADLADMASRLNMSPRTLLSEWKKKPPVRGEQGALWSALDGIPELALFAAENPGQTTQYHAGITPLDQWSMMDIDQKRPYHEQWARGFEAYAFEGKAPSLDLQHAFQTFRAWLVNVYRALLKSVNASKTDIADTMKVELSDEVRSVMDRMLATSDQIAEAEAARNMGPLFKSSEQAGMTLEEFKAYHDQGTQATMDAVDALQARGLRDMQWLNNARSRKLKELQKQHDALRAQVASEVRAEVMSQPIYQAWTFLTSKSESKAIPGVTDLATADTTQSSGKLRTQVLRDMYGTQDDAVWRKLSGLHMTSDEAGLHPDLVGELFGFSSGDELVKTLVVTEPPKSVIEGMTDTRMLQEHGDLATPAGLERAADAAIHNEARAKFVATELKALEKAMSVREAVPGQKNTVDVLARAARDYAAQVVAKLRVRDIRPGQYAAAEVRAAKAAAKAVGDVALAAQHKRNQLINLYATKAAYAAQDEVKAAVEYFKKFDSASLRAKLPSDYVAQIDMLLEKFDLRAQSGAQVDRTKSLRTWVQSRLNAGEIPAISESLLTPQEQKDYSAAINARDEDGNLVYPDDDERIKLLADAIERSAKRSVKDMTVEEVRGLRDTIKQIEHLARRKNKMMTDRDGRSYSETRDALVAAIVANAKASGKNVRTDNTWIGGKLEGLKQFGASHIKPAIWMRIFDGGQDNGAWWSTIVRPANERANFETSRRAKATEQLMAALAPVLKDVNYLDKVGKGQFFPELGTSLNWEERFSMALNYGNESNLQRLMGGGIAGVSKSLTMPQIHAVLNTLTLAEWNAAQAVWDHFESYRPEIAAKELRVNGVEPQWIDPRPFSIRTADGGTVRLRGGYFPVVFDPKTSLKAQQHSDAQASKDAMKAAYSAATTQRSFTKARVEEVHGRPLLLNLRGLYSGVNDVIHDLAWHEWVIDMNRIMRSQSVDEAIRDHYGANVKKELTKWRDDIVAGSKRLDHGIENAAGWARKFVSSAALTYNVMSAALQPLGITQSFARVGTKWVGKGIGQYLSGPVEATQMVREKSEYMANRTRTMFRDVNELRNRVDGQTTARELMGRYGYFLTMHFQMMVDVPTWIGAYEKAIAGGFDEATAKALADQSVKDSQGGGEEVDQAGITRGGPMIKLFTAFYDFMNTQANVLYLKNATAENKADKFVHFALVGAATPILAALLKDALTAGDSGDWDDWDKIWKKMLSEGLNNLIGLVAFGREFTQAAKALMGEDKGMGYSGPAGVRVFPDAYKLAQQMHQGDMDDGFRKAFINLVGDLTGIPSVAVNRAITGGQALHDGKTSNPAALLTGYQEPH